LGQYRGLVETGELRRPAADPVVNDPQLSFQLAQALEDLDFMSILLRNRSEVERLKTMTDYLTAFRAENATGCAHEEVGPFNGHGSTPSGM